jgi:hypothetical protein
MYMDGLSNYESLQAEFEKRLSQGVSMLAGYIFSKSIDNAAGESASPMRLVNLFFGMIDTTFHARAMKLQT